MPLNYVDLDLESITTPDNISQFIRSVDGLVQQHRVKAAASYHGFVPSDYEVIYRCLRTVYDSPLLAGKRFCEWGSGISIVAALAAMIGYESHGIEYDPDLCRVAADLCADFAIPVELVHGSFIPAGVDDLVDEAYIQHDGELALHTDSDNAYEELGRAVDEFDLIFVYPWPNDVELTHQIFDRCAGHDALMLVYYSCESVGLYRKSPLVQA